VTLLFTDTAISVELDGAGNPVAYTRQGRRRAFARVVERHEVHTDWWEPAGELHRAYHALITFDGQLVSIYQDLLAGGWFLARLYD
jgi:hypothetical protein